ncbi:hypothetical protein MASR2M66_25750 [Chloroflexota bacterium]
MRTQMIEFPDRKTLCIFPDEPSDLTQALTELNLGDGYPVIVLIGGAIDERQAAATEGAIQTIAKLAQEMNILVICGGTDMGVMAEIGQVRSQNNYTFPLVGITLEDMVAFPGGPQSTKVLWWGKERWQLEPHYPYFILVPGSKFGDESLWIVDAATIFSKGNQSVTILINGGEISRKDIQLSLEEGRSVLALSRTGRLADEISRDLERNKLITVISAKAERQISEFIYSTLHIDHSRTTA